MTNEEAFRKWRTDYESDYDKKPSYLEVWRAAIAYMQEQSEPLPPIEYDQEMDRWYIPMIGGWEIQTKGKGSTFRICNTKTHVRWPVLDEHLHEALEQMAKDNRHAYTTPQRQQPLKRLSAERLGELTMDWATDIERTPKKLALAIMDEMERINK